MNAAVIVAAGRGERMGSEKNKILLPLLGIPVLVRTLQVFRTSGFSDDYIVVVASQRDREEIGTLLKEYGFTDVQIVLGGKSRQESVYHGLKACPEDTELVAIHDAARPLVTSTIIAEALKTAAENGNGTVAVPLKDTIKRVNADGMVVETPDRSALRVIQTPQVFQLSGILRVHSQYAEGEPATDDAALLERAGVPVYLSAGSPENIKITTPEDLLLAQEILMKRECVQKMEIRVGHGYDVHKLVPDRKLILCGVEVPYERGLLGHSDADVAAHALMDAMLGAAAMGDIGYHFPDTDPQYAGADSMILLDHVTKLLQDKGWRVSNADITIICQRPKLRPFIDEMRAVLAGHMGISIEQVSVKATTTEHLGFEGEGLGISTHAVVLIERGQA